MRQLGIAFPLLFLSCCMADIDPLWLRFAAVTDEARLAEYKTLLPGVAIIGDDATCRSMVSMSQMKTAQKEVETALAGLLGQDIPVSCCDPNSVVQSVEHATVSIVQESMSELGSEGYRVGRTSRGQLELRAATSSGALYGVFRLLSFLQRSEPVPEHLVSTPAMALRIWDLWDELDGSITRGFAGRSIIWPMALYDDDKPPPRSKIYMAPCNDSDPWQQWNGTTFMQQHIPSVVKNNAADMCITTTNADPVSVGACSGPNSAEFVYNHSNFSLAITKASAGSSGHSSVGSCLDLNGGSGPDIDLWTCHDASNLDYKHQQFEYNTSKGHLRTSGTQASSQCLTVERDAPHPPGTPSPWFGGYKKRFADMLRLLKSAGINALALQDVNSCGIGTKSLESSVLQNWTQNLAPIFDSFAITPYLSVCFSAPTVLDNVTSDPLNSETQRWWANKVTELYQRMPNLGGFLVKADSEGNIGPQSFNRTEADGANMLARALKPHGGKLLWRAFVYGVSGSKIGHEDLARQSFDTFFPLDGFFDENVILQIKNGPMDFQVREPLHPLLGALKHTNVIMEVQATQEYLGQQIHAVSLTRMWESYLGFDTRWNGRNSTIANLLSAKPNHGIACVSNIGNWANWTGHILAASNTYGFGRLGWNPWTSAEEINTDWTEMTFPQAGNSAQRTIISMLQRSWAVYEGYTSPLGIGFMVAQNNSNGCAPKTRGPGLGPGGQVCPKLICHGCPEFPTGGHGAGTDHYWLDPCVNYDFQNGTNWGLGCDRTRTGTGYADLYSPEMRTVLSNVDTCPTELLLFFHNLPWDHLIHKDDNAGNTKTLPLFELIKRGHAEALVNVQKLADDWGSLKGQIDDLRFDGVKARFAQQVNDANVFSKVIVGYYGNISGRVWQSELEYI